MPAIGEDYGFLFTKGAVDFDIEGLQIRRGMARTYSRLEIDCIWDEIMLS